MWTITTDPQNASRLQAAYPVSGMVSHAGSVTIRLVSATAPAAGAAPVEPNLEDAYLLIVQSEKSAAA